MSTNYYDFFVLFVVIFYSVEKRLQVARVWITEHILKNIPKTMLKIPGRSFGAFRPDKSIHKSQRFLLLLTLVGVG